MKISLKVKLITESKSITDRSYEACEDRRKLLIMKNNVTS